MIHSVQLENLANLKEVGPEKEYVEASSSVESASWHALPGSFRICAANAAGSVLLETAKQDGMNDRSFLFLNPVHELVARTDRDLDPLCTEIDRHLSEGMFVAGYFAYECGEHFVGLRPGPDRDGVTSEPLAWLGVYETAIQFHHSSGAIWGSIPTPERATTDSTETARIVTDGLQISRERYHAALSRISQHLEAGHTYQVNFTDKVNGHAECDPLAVYNMLLKQQPVSFAAFIHRAEGALLSFSPELFFRTTRGRIVVRPMKGTWRRGNDMAEDREAERYLCNDEKNRSEHVMIVDLLRNDLGRICKYGSIKVDKLFHVERYNTLLQMTSTCSGVLQDGLSPSQVFQSLFPSGSITGAPKRRTMEIIRELEQYRRGAYTGSIGYFGPDGEACFNVAIRTVELQHGRLTMGVGGGITADSKPDEEFEECSLKARFLTNTRPAFSLIETMRCNGGIALLSLHMARLSGSAQYFGIRYDEDQLLTELTAVVRNCGSIENKVRVELSETGNWHIEATPMGAVPWSGRLLLAKERVSSEDVFLRHKTTNRERYERSLMDARGLGFDEVLFLNERSEITEGAISNIFVLIDGIWTTPPLQSGILPGVQRSHMLQSFLHTAERVIGIDDLSNAKSICVCSALRGVRPVLSIQDAQGNLLWKSISPATIL